MPCPLCGDNCRCSSDASDDSSLWRLEVAARLNRYQARRKPRPPRYPSLRLRFEPEVQPVPPDHFTSNFTSRDLSLEERGIPAEIEGSGQSYPSIMPSVSNRALALDEFVDILEAEERAGTQKSRFTRDQDQERTAALGAPPEDS